ncbi:MAG TPA: DUF4129 domain-containing protein [Puia sp.]|nr:DUF4129 domain-containing protein [Puia sp.]
MIKQCQVRIAVFFLGLFLCCRAAAQTGDTVVVGQGPAAAAAATDSDAGTNNAVKPPRPDILRVLPDTFVHRLRSDEAFAYANDPAYWTRRKEEQEQPKESWLSQLLGSKGFEVFILIVFGAVLLYAIIRIVASNNLAFFYRRPRRIGESRKNDVAGATEEDLDERLKQSVLAGEYQHAVRYLYLKSLGLLEQKGMIRLHPEATNHDYWRQLSSSPQGPPFRDLTTIHERVVYGNFPLDEQRFLRLKRYFDDFYKTVQS